MTRERWEQILFAHVPDEVVQNMLNAYVLELEAKNDKLRELVRDMRTCIVHACMCEFCPLFITSEDMDERRCIANMKAHMRELGVDDVLRTE